jgi:proteasome lid subunit RPN8/RPN11
VNEQTTQLEVVTFYEGVKGHIERHAKREAQKGGYEAVGLVAARADEATISSAMELHNHSSSPQQTFFVEPWEQFRAQRALEEAGFELRGIYHSHPTGEAEPSNSDHEMARAKEVMLIYSVTFEELHGWREKEGSLVPIQLEFVDPEE